MMPLRDHSLPRGPNMQLYRDFDFGRLAKFCMLDTRQHRTDQPNGDGMRPLTGDALSPKGTLLGAKQRGWMQSSLIASQAQWNILGQQIMMAMVGVKESGEPLYYMDGWSGYNYERMQLVKFLQDRRIPNPIVLTGDSHENWVNHLRVDDRELDLPVVATEFMGTSISSDGNGVEKPAAWDNTVPHNPGVQFYNGERGYVRCTVTPDLWRADFRTLQDISKPGAPIATRASFVIEPGQPAAKKA
jgi:alkaline phosphatase D